MNTLLPRRRALLEAGARHVGWKVGAGIIAANVFHRAAALGIRRVPVPGDVVLGGSLCHVPVAAGSSVAAQIEGVERVAVSLAGG